MDGLHCCETCPDEEQLLSEQRQHKTTTTTDNNSSSVKQPPQLETAIKKTELNQLTPSPSPSLVGIRKLMFESTLSQSYDNEPLIYELTDDDKVISKTRKGSLDRFSDDKTSLEQSNTDDKNHVRLGVTCTKVVDGCDEKTVDNVRLGSTCTNDYTSVDCSSVNTDDNSKNNVRLGVTCTKDYNDGCGANEQKIVEDDDNNIPFIDSVDDASLDSCKTSDADCVVPESADASADLLVESRSNIVVVHEEKVVLNEPKLVVDSLDVDKHRFSGKLLDKCDVNLPLVSSSNLESGSSVVSSSPVGDKLGVNQDTYVEMKPLTPEPSLEHLEEPIYEEIKGNLSPPHMRDKTFGDLSKLEEKSVDESAKDDIGHSKAIKVSEPVESFKTEEPVVAIKAPPKRRKTPVIVESKVEIEGVTSLSSSTLQSETRKEESKSDDYPIDLNPFGDDEDDDAEEIPKKEVIKVEDEKLNVSASTNPFGSDDEDEEEEIVTAPKPVERRKKHSPAPSTNPFESDEDEEESQSEATSLLQPVPLPRKLKSPQLSPTPKPRGLHSRTSSMSSSIGVPLSPSPRKKKPAPPPPLSAKQMKSRPPPAPAKSPAAPASECRGVSPTPSEALSVASTMSAPDMPEKSLKDATNRQTQSATTADITATSTLPGGSSYILSVDKSAVGGGTWQRRKKAPAPLPPTAQRRPVRRPMSLTELRRELNDIEVRQLGLERQGVSLEQTIRQRCDLESSVTPHVEELVLQLFELVNEKNDLFRRQAELMYLRRQHNLEEEHAELEYQIRLLMLCPEQNKTDSDKEREEALIQRLVEIVERRNEIVQCLEMDRLREAEEDRSVNAQLDTFSAAAVGIDVEPDKETLSKKEEKKSKKEKKKGKIDIDKDIDESEKQKKKNKKKWFTLQHSPKRL